MSWSTSSGKRLRQAGGQQRMPRQGLEHFARQAGLASCDPPRGVDFDQLGMRTRPEKDLPVAVLDLASGPQCRVGTQGFALLAAHQIGLEPAVRPIGRGRADARHKGRSADSAISGKRPIATPRARSSSPAGASTWGTATRPDFRGKHAGRDNGLDPSSERRPASPVENGRATHVVDDLADGLNQALTVRLSGRRGRAGSRRRSYRASGIGQERVADPHRAPRRGDDPIPLHQPRSGVGRPSVQGDGPRPGLAWVGCKSAMFFAFSLPLRPGRAILRQNKTR